MRKTQSVEDQIYHIYNRGVEKRNIFLENKDYFRFIHNLFEFNNEESFFNSSYHFNHQHKKLSGEFQSQCPAKKPRKLLVEILMFTLMPNHFHLVLKQKSENGISKFMHKLGTGYTNYFNKKNKRVGGLFQEKFKASIINEEAYFIHIPFYLHTNPLRLLGDKKENEGSQAFFISSEEKMEFLENYRWSSFPDYIGKKNFPSVTSRDFFLDFFGGQEKYKKETKEWLKNTTKEVG